jgi:hypothetical protein
MIDEPVDAELHANSDTRLKSIEHRRAQVIDLSADKAAITETTLLDGSAKAYDSPVVIPQRATGITLSGKVLQEPLAMGPQPCGNNSLGFSDVDSQSHGRSFR